MTRSLSISGQRTRHRPKPFQNRFVVYVFYCRSSRTLFVSMFHFSMLSQPDRLANPLRTRKSIRENEQNKRGRWQREITQKIETHKVLASYWSMCRSPSRNKQRTRHKPKPCQNLVFSIASNLCELLVLQLAGRTSWPANLELDN